MIAGLKAGETVVVHPGDDLPEGTVVEPVPCPSNVARFPAAKRISTGRVTTAGLYLFASGLHVRDEHVLARNFSNKAAGLSKLVASTSSGFPAIHSVRSMSSVDARVEPDEDAARLVANVLSNE